MSLTRNFTKEEFERSATAQRLGIDNSVPANLVGNLQRLAEGMQKVRDVLNCPVVITSGYRSPALNKAVGGVPNSSHAQAEAADFVCFDFGSVQAVCDAIIKSGIEFDQLIKESSKSSEWVHIGFGERMRQQVLTYKGGKYFNGLV